MKVIVFVLCAFLLSARPVGAVPPEGIARGLERAAQSRAEVALERQAEVQAATAARRAAQTWVDAVQRQAESRANTNPSGGGSTRAANVIGKSEHKDHSNSPTDLVKSKPNTPERKPAKSNNSIAAERHYKVVENTLGYERLEHQTLMLLSEAQYTKLNARGLHSVRVTTLEALGGVLVEVDESQAQRQLGANDAKQQTANFIYRLDGRHSGGVQTWAPHEALPLKRSGKGLKIGQIDTAVDVAHPAFQRSSIKARAILESGLQPSVEHGTAIASILVGNNDHFRGLLPEAQLSAASVFYNSPDGHIASLKSLILALDWLMQENVSVINLSLSGPPNSLLESVIEKVLLQGITLVAAAGNGGAGAQPAYPAAYHGVMAVTAIDKQHRLYYLANHGDYIDFAAPGVDLLHAIPGTNFSASSGTSFATPFVVALTADLSLNQSQKRNAINIMNILKKNTIDLGSPGRDDLFGYGLVTPGD